MGLRWPLGSVFLPFRLPFLAEKGGVAGYRDVVVADRSPLGVYFFFDKKLDAQTEALRAAGDETLRRESDQHLKTIFTSKTLWWWPVCAYFYSASSRFVLPECLKAVWG